MIKKKIMEGIANNSINKDLCKKCKLCIEICPCNVIGMNGGVHFIRDRTHICLKCGQCMAVCKTQAIAISGLDYEKDFRELPDGVIKYNEFADFISTRRSVRNFKEEPVPNEMLDQVLESVSYAPFGAAPEKMNVTVVNKREKLEQALPHISDFLENIVKWIENPIASFMIKRKEDKETYNTLKNHLYPIAKQGNYKLEFGDRITRNAPALLIFHAEKGAEAHTHNSIIYATYAMLAAHSSGLGAAMNGIVPAAINKNKKVRDIFEIPEGNKAIISLLIGFPRYKYQRIIHRQKHKITRLMA
jgi:nitroreductase/NAD-dependent dihydropyrimidine dehydrogenase PreA subunit